MVVLPCGCFSEFPEAASDGARPRGPADLDLRVRRPPSDSGAGDVALDARRPPDAALRLDARPPPDGAPQRLDGQVTPPARDAFVRPPTPDVAEPPDSGVPDEGLRPDVPIRPPDGTGLVINEFDYDQPSTDDAEFVELYNRGPSVIDLDDYRLELINGTNPDAPYTIQLDGRLRAGQYFVIGDVDGLEGDVIVRGFPDDPEARLQNDHEGIRLIDRAGIRVDSVSYEGRVEGVTEGLWDADFPLEDDGTQAEESLGRCPNGRDSDDNIRDFELMVATPGAPNACVR